MDKYAFLLELNTNLGMKISDNEINGDVSGLTIKVCYTPDGSLRVNTKAYIGGQNAFKEHVQSAFNKTSTFADFILENEVIDLYAPKETLSMDAAFNIAQDIMIFATTLTAMGYKSTNSPIDIEGGVSMLQGEYYSGDVKDDSETSRFYLKSPRMGMGILGAFIGTIITLFLCVVAGMTNSWIFFIPAVMIGSFLPVFLYELLAKERVCFIGIIVCLLFTLFALLLGDRLVWAITLIDFFPDVTFLEAFLEVPYLVEDGVVAPMDYYKDFIMIFSCFGLIYLLAFVNFFFRKATIMELVKNNNN
ncbi:MAG: hypothetical protein IKT10_00730 [Clostridiales bacterium]|nr:hypothetical protein [Clostridiales bacterium]